MLSKNNINTFLSTLNFVLSFVGYALVTSLFLPISSDIEGISRSITVPYRAFALLISLIVILNNLMKKGEKLPFALKLFWWFWFFLTIRIFYDTQIRTDVHVHDTTQLWLYIFAICITSMFSILKSYKSINLDKALLWILTATIITQILSLFNNELSFVVKPDDLTERASANLALNTISYGHIGTMGLLLSLYTLYNKKMKLFFRILLIFFVLLSFFTVLRAGSRGPIVALFFSLLFWAFGKGKDVVLGVSIVAIVTLTTVIFIEPILSFFGDVSPVMENRMRATIFEGDSSGRDYYFYESIRIFIDNPFWGKQFAFFNSDGTFINSHNFILDAFMGLGFLGGASLIYILVAALKKSYLFFKQNDPAIWIGLVYVQQIIVNLFSGAIYSEVLINVLLVFIFMYQNNNQISSNVNKSILDEVYPAT